MDPRNQLFLSTVRLFKDRLNTVISNREFNNMYISKHAIERAVERNLDNPVRFPQIIRMLAAVYESYSNNTYNLYSYKILFKDLVIIAAINLDPVSNVRRLVIKTIWDVDCFKEEFSEVIKA